MKLNVSIYIFIFKIKYIYIYNQLKYKLLTVYQRFPLHLILDPFQVDVYSSDIPPSLLE